MWRRDVRDGRFFRFRDVVRSPFSPPGKICGTAEPHTRVIFCPCSPPSSPELGPHTSPTRAAIMGLMDTAAKLTGKVVRFADDYKVRRRRGARAIALPDQPYARRLDR